MDFFQDKLWIIIDFQYCYKLHSVYDLALLQNPVIGTWKVIFSTENFYLLIVTSESKEKDVEENEDIGFFTGTKLYIVIACIAALTLVAIVQIGCTIYKMANKPSSGSKVCIWDG